MSQNEKIAVAILLPLGVFLLVILLIYLFGNVYNGLVKRKGKVEHSWHELSKSLSKAFNMIPSLLQNVSGSKEERDSLVLIYKTYEGLDCANRQTSRELADLDKAFGAVCQQMSLNDKENVVLGFILETRRMNDFSISLYNHNVRDYMKFKNLFINRFLSRAWKFPPIGEFKAQEGPDSLSLTIGMRLKNVIDK